MIKGMNHVGISVRDLDRSLAFYRDVLGMEVVIAAAFGGEKYEKVLDLQGTRGRAALLRLKGTEMRVELFEFDRPTPKAADPVRPVCDHGITHFALAVEDIHGEYRRLQAAGVVFHCPPVMFSPSAWATYARDPDGNVFELLEQADESAALSESSAGPSPPRLAE